MIVSWLYLYLFLYNNKNNKFQVVGLNPDTLMIKWISLVYQNVPDGCVISTIIILIIEWSQACVRRFLVVLLLTNQYNIGKMAFIEFCGFSGKLMVKFVNILYVYIFLSWNVVSTKTTSLCIEIQKIPVQEPVMDIHID